MESLGRRGLWEAVTALEEVRRFFCVDQIHNEMTMSKF